MSGDAGSNACPAGSVRIVTEAACRTAVTAAGKTPSPNHFVETYDHVPRGCFYFTGSNNAIFNADAVGTGVSYAQPLCAAATVTTGAPTA